MPRRERKPRRRALKRTNESQATLLQEKHDAAASLSAQINSVMRRASDFGTKRHACKISTVVRVINRGRNSRPIPPGRTRP